MSRLLCASIAFVVVLFISASASAQTAFVEGHVFNKRSGVPLPGAIVRVTENVTLGPIPIELASGVTDANGFYQFEIDEFLGFPATIEVVCRTAKRQIRGGSSALLREGLIRRDVYLGGSRHLTHCRPIESQ